MTVLLVSAGIVAWLLLGLITARVWYRAGVIERDDPPLIVLVPLLLWPAAWAARGAIVLHRLVTRPTRRQRIEARREQDEREAATVDHLAAEYNLPTVD